MMGILIEWILYKRGSRDKMRNKGFLLAQTFLSKRKLYQRNKVFSKGFCGAKKFVYTVAGKPEWESAIEVYSDRVLKAVGIDDLIVTYEDAEPFTTNIKTIDCSKAVKDLKHDPKVTPEEGIRRTVEWLKRYYRTG